jgi:hypothetical protein
MSNIASKISDTFINDFLGYLFTNDETGMVLKVHLYIEQKLDELVRVIFPNPDSILKYPFSRKVSILNSMEVLGERSYNNLLVINNIRNKFSHKLGYKLSKNDLSQLREISDFSKDSVPKKIRILNLPNNALLLAIVAAHFAGTLGYQIEISKSLDPLSTISLKKFVDEHKENISKNVVKNTGKSDSK